MTQPVKDVVLSLLWHRFDPWPGNLHMVPLQPKKKKKKKAQRILESFRFRPLTIPHDTYTAVGRQLSVFSSKSAFSQSNAIMTVSHPRKFCLKDTGINVVPSLSLL